MLAFFEYWMWKKLIEVVHYKCHLYIYIEREREKESWRQSSMYLYYMRYLLWGIGSLNNGGWDVPQSTKCKPEIQESWWYDSNLSENQESQWWNSQSKGRRPVSQFSRQAGQKKGWVLFLSLSFVLFGLLMDWMISTHTGEGNLLYGAHQFKC